MSNPQKVIIVDDHTQYREKLRMFIEAFGEFETIGEASNGLEFLKLLEKTIPDIIFMDINMPIMNGIEATVQATTKYGDLNIITLTVYGEEEYALMMNEAGARGFLMKNFTNEDISKAIKEVMSGGFYWQKTLVDKICGNEECF